MGGMRTALKDREVQRLKYFRRLLPLLERRLHLQLDLKTFAPCRATVTGACNAGAMREHNAIRAQLEGGRCYVGDCAYGDRGLLDGIVAVDSSYVMRKQPGVGADLPPRGLDDDRDLWDKVQENRSGSLRHHLRPPYLV
jgi:hypothetical protein